MPGHVFVIQGSLAHLDYDAVLIPTDRHFRVNPGWGEVAGLSVEATGADGFGALRPENWGDTRYGRARIVSGGTILLRPTWFIDSAWDDGQDPLEALGAVSSRLASTLREIAAAGLAVPKGRTHLLVALPTLGTGDGGFGEIRGAVIDALLATCQAAVEDTASDVLLDIVIVASNPANYTAFQSRRRELSHHHSHLGSKLETDARELARLAAEGNLALFLGAGVGIAAGLPSWSQLLEELGEKAAGEADELAVVQRGKISDLSSDLDRAELLHLELGEGFGAAVADLIEGTTRYAITHAMLASLGCGEVVTTNYDQLYEKAASDIQPDGTIATLPFDQARARTPWVLKMHGDIREPGSIVLTRSDFVSYDAKSRPLGSVVQSLMITKHLLVVGASMTDDNFLRLAHEVFAFNADGAPGGGAQRGPIGTVLTLTEEPIKARLWKNRFHYIPLSDKGIVADQARDLAIFLDFVALLTAGNEHLIDHRFSGLLGSLAELEAANTARRLADQIDQLPGAVSGPWIALRHQLGELGAGKRLTSRERHRLAAAPRATEAAVEAAHVQAFVPAPPAIAESLEAIPERPAAAPVSSPVPTVSNVPAREDVTLWDKNGLYAWVNWGVEGRLVFQGQSLSGGGEYEYAISVLSADVPKLVAALGGEDGADVIELIKANGESIVHQGEQTWLKGLGITSGFWARSSD